ncbi:hypothetical protein MKQ68_21670 [Chitinophaga horti]|uniref:YtxH domain-containing protein n=1 Tax=Chitinophaga horti TaxID=2920382 RepID=A0ABY6IZ75_9BACT|nr:hypothetical protein [Chitinophaga horti]UYQ92691.1 hypothetical protein MKQ68_21670 [Chitinophaga horti]
MNKHQKTMLWSGLAAGAALAIIVTALQKRKKQQLPDIGDMQRKLFRREQVVRKAS